MANERFGFDEEPVRRNSSGCLKGCLIALAAILVLMALAGFFVSQNWRGWVGSMAGTLIDQTLESSALPAEEKIEVKEQLNRVTEAFSSGAMSGDQMERLMVQLVESPLFAAFMVYAVEEKYFDQSGLSDEEKEAGKTSLMRFVRGLTQEKIDEQAMEEVMDHIGDRQNDGSWQMRDQVSDQELRAMLATANKHADAAEIPEEVEKFDPSDELKLIIDQALATSQGQPANDLQE